MEINKIVDEMMSPMFQNTMATSQLGSKKLGVGEKDFPTPVSKMSGKLKPVSKKEL